MGQIFDPLPAEDGAAAPPMTNPATWNQGLNATAAAYLRDVNIFGMIMAVTSSLSGSYSTFWNPGPGKTRMNNASMSWDQYDAYLSWSGNVIYHRAGQIRDHLLFIFAIYPQPQPWLIIQKKIA